MNKVVGYQCSICAQQFGMGEVTYVCPHDGGNLDVVLDYETISRDNSPDKIQASRDASMWRYLPLLPVDDPGFEGTPLRSVGMTPIYSPKRLANKLGLRYLWVQDESSNPSASFKDRASALLVARAREIDAEVIVTASTGNAGAALAGMAAAVGHKAVIIAPRNAPPAKIAQLLTYGSQVLLVNGTYDDAFSLSIRTSEAFGWYCRNSGYNPFTVEGKKTAAYEIWEKLLLTRVVTQPMLVFVSVGDGNIISGVHKGFKDLLAMGWIEQMPRIFGVQSEGSAAIANAFFEGTDTIKPVVSNTLADSISVDMPSDGYRALRAARETGGGFITVSDDQILDAIKELGQVGIFSEPAGATSYAGVVKAVKGGLIDPGHAVVAINTGSGLKDVAAAMTATGEAPVIEPTLDAVKMLMENGYE
jgi:threonine synthase